jgi:hypothetical protein
MRSGLSVCAGLAMSLVGVTSLSAAVIPVTAFNPVGNPGGGSILANGVNNQPLTDPVAGTNTPAVPTDNTWSFFGDNRYAGLDFGENYASVVIHDVYVNQGTYGTADAPESYFWSTDTTVGDDQPAPDFNLLNYVGTGGTQQWLHVFHSDTGVTPLARYLIVARGAGGNEGNFKYEVAFVTVPEPAGLGLAGLGGGLALLRRRNRGK